MFYNVLRNGSIYSSCLSYVAAIRTIQTAQKYDTDAIFIIVRMRKV